MSETKETLVKIKANTMTKQKMEIKTINDNIYDVQTSLPVLELDDGSVLIFPGMDIFMMFYKDEMFRPEPDMINDDILRENIDIQEDVDPDTNRYNNIGITGIDIIGLDLVTDGEEKAQYIQLFRLYL